MLTPPKNNKSNDRISRENKPAKESNNVAAADSAYFTAGHVEDIRLLLQSPTRP